MAKIKFREVRLSKLNSSRLDAINSIIREYQADGYKLTLRQLYYQLVSRDVIANKQAEYAKLSTLLKEGRMGGIVDWDAIEDRLRQPSVPSSWDSPKEIIESAIYSYALPRLEGQANYIEVWVEKDALSGVLKRVTEQYHIPIVVNRGYSSVTAMHDAYGRFVKSINKGKYDIHPVKVVIFYLGDFDPSGIDMIRDITDRIKEFFKGSSFIHSLWMKLGQMEQEIYISRYDKYVTEYDERVGKQVKTNLGKADFFDEWFEENFSVVPIALTMAQIEQYTPPPNPAKITDPRAAKYIELYGDTSWEVDALPPPVLNGLLEEAIRGKIDVDKYDEICGRESADKQKIRDLLENL